MLMIALAALLAAPAPPAADASAQAPKSAPKLRCKREVETGSLAKFNKVCKTDAEWTAQRREARNTTTDLQNPTASSRN